MGGVRSTTTLAAMPLLRRVATATTAAVLGATAGTLWVASRPRRAAGEPSAPEPPVALPPGRLVPVAGHGELFVREAGPVDGPPVVLLHGWMYPSDLTWWTCYEPLAAFARVVAVDHRGHGHGTRPSQPFRLADVADDVAALLRSLGTGPAVAVGYSMGGAVAQLLWQRSPRRRARAGARGDQLDVERERPAALELARDGAAAGRSAGRATRRLAVAVRRAGAGALPFPVTQMINDETPKELAAYLPWIVGELDRGSAEDLAEAGRELGRYDARGWLPTVDVPVGVIVTTADRLVPPEFQADLVARIPTARRYDVDVDHDGVIAHPDRFVPVLCRAITEILSPP